jgi:tetratricopeptide (TPR) repeat protein
VSLQLRMLGTLSVSQGGRALELPASRKVRALFAYLALAPRATSRHRLCRLLWDTASDPRGELRWALSKLRGVVGAERISSREDSVRLDLADSFVDAFEIQRAAHAGIGTLAPERARDLLVLFGGEFLEGLELDGCTELAAWLLFQRRCFSAWRAALLELAPLDVHAYQHLPPSDAAEQSYDYYLQGRQHLARMMQRGLEASRSMFVRALELDPGYAPAWAGLATVHACLYEWFDPRKVRLAHAEQTSRRALEAAPRLAEAHVARGLALSLSRHYDEAVGEFEQAIRINPYLFEACYYFARTAFARGDMARAAEMFGRAAQLRPEDFQSPMLLGTAARALGRETAAREAVRSGIRRAELVLALNPHDGRALSLGAGALIDDDQTERGLEWSRRCLDLYPSDTSALVNVACVHARVGQKDEALNLLDRVLARGCGKRDWIVNDPDYASLRNEPRFQHMLSRVR